MSELKIGGYKNRYSAYDDIVIEPVAPDQPDNTNLEPDNTIVDTPEPHEPVVDDLNVDNPINVDPIETDIPDNTPHNINTSLLSFDTPSDEPSVDLTDENFLQKLSEKLGRPVRDFNELNNTPVNPLDADPYLKQLVEWRNSTGRPIEDWVKFQKDYSTMSDINVARELLQYKYPNLTESEIDLEMTNFLPEDEFDESAAMKTLNLKKLATEGRQILGSLKSTFAEPSPVRYSQEVQDDLALAKQVRSNMANAQANKETYRQGVVNVSSKMNSFKIPLNDNVVLDYKISDQSKNEIPSLIDNMPHWVNQDGSTNFEAIVTDAVKIKHFDDIIKVVYEQAFNSGKDAILKETNNVNFSEPAPNGGRLNNTSKGVVIEGFDDFLGNNKMSLRSR